MCAWFPPDRFAPVFHVLDRGNMLFKWHLFFCRRSRHDPSGAVAVTEKTFLVTQLGRVRIAYLNSYPNATRIWIFDSPAIILNSVGIVFFSELFRHRKGTRCVPWAWILKSLSSGKSGMVLSIINQSILAVHTRLSWPKCMLSYLEWKYRVFKEPLPYRYSGI